MALAGAGSRRRKASRKYAHSMARHHGAGGPTYLPTETAGSVRRTIAKMKACRATADEVASAGVKAGRIPGKMSQKVRAAYRKALTTWKNC